MASTLCTSLILVLCVSTLGTRIYQARLEPKKFQKGERCDCGSLPYGFNDDHVNNTCCEDGLVCSGKVKLMFVLGEDEYKNHRCKPDLGPKGSPCTKKSECPSSGPYSWGAYVSCQVLAGEADQHPHCCIKYVWGPHCSIQVGSKTIDGFGNSPLDQFHALCRWHPSRRFSDVHPTQLIQKKTHFFFLRTWGGSLGISPWLGMEVFGFRKRFSMIKYVNVCFTHPETNINIS